MFASTSVKKLYYKEAFNTSCFESTWISRGRALVGIQSIQVNCGKDGLARHVVFSWN